jgi:hypothetical protein
MKTILKASVLAAIGSLYASLTLAADTSAVPVVPSSLLEAIQQGKPMTNFRLRYESVDQDGYQGTTPTARKLDTAHAWTLRSLVGWQTAPFKNFSFAVQVTDVHEFNDDFNDRRHNQPEHNNGTGSASLDKRQYPNIVDPGYTDINQFYVDWTGIKNTKLRLGRQVLNLDNVRFIGDIAFRQNTQVFDGISVLNKSIPDTEIFLAHFGKVRQITTKLRDGNIDILNAKYRFTPTESLTGYGYFIDVANLGQNGGNPAAVGTAAQGGNGLGGSSDIPASASNVNPAQTDASSKTFGLRLDGVHVFNPTWKGLYTAEYAKQTDYRGGSDLIDAHYYKIGGGVGYDAWSIRIDHEKLSSNGGKYAFQTPLGTNHLFQGWADHFLATPRQGMEDTFVTLAGSIEKAKLYAEYHVFHADKDFQTLGGRLGDKYGTEFDASVMYPFTDKLSGKVEYANFREGDVYGTTLQNAARKGDKEILWVTGMYTF